MILAGLYVSPDVQFTCRDCKRRCVLKGEFLHRFTNVPKSNGLSGRIVRIDSAEKVHFLADIVRRSLPEKIAELDLFQTHLNICPISVIDQVSVEIMERYSYAKKFSVPPFDGGFDAQPRWWREAVRIIESEMLKIQRKNSGTARN